MIPELKKAAVKNALQMAFGFTAIDDIRELTAGLSSALIYRIVVQGKPYLLRIITLTDAMGDPAHYYACMQTAAAEGIAPQVWYAGIEDRISITDFIEPKPFPARDAREKMPEILKRLHAMPPFPFRLNYFDFVERTIRKFRDQKILPDEMTTELFRQYARITAIYPINGKDMVACHNDLKPENIIYDGARPWLVDWEAAFLNDRYSDLAIVANFLVANPNEEREFLKRYFGEAPDAYQMARFFLAQQVMHMSYFVFMLCITAGKIPVDPEIVIPDFRTFHNQLWNGEITLHTDPPRQLYGLIHMERLRHNFELQRFEDSLKIVSEQT
jgi:thiamine kinase-like enzyme